MRQIGGTFIDITTMLSYRPDGHIEADCGHWCLPGPYDVAATLLHNAALGLLGGIVRARVRVRVRARARGRGRGRVRVRVRDRVRATVRGRVGVGGRVGLGLGLGLRLRLRLGLG